ncbi:MAG: hypothetical protein HZA50_15990 [Planctomycetes bacterium]|nr:hypothetical protein [Planctomycetota bacterium]
MKKIIPLFAILALTGLAGSMPTEPADNQTTDNLPAQRVIFRAVDVWVDSAETPLAAYQVEVNYDQKAVKIVGVEGGVPVCYRSAPYYDEAGKAGGRIILAAFVSDDNTAPAGKVRVARLHLQIAGETLPDCQIKLVTAAKPGGERFKPVAQISESKISE